MKKILVYSVVAVVLGLSLMLVPLITLAEKTGNHYLMPHSLSEQLEKIEGASADPKYSMSDVKILGFSFLVASVMYLLFRRKTSHPDYGWSGRGPY